jgi:hypothetical protein
MALHNLELKCLAYKENISDWTILSLWLQLHFFIFQSKFIVERSLCPGVIQRTWGQSE